VLARRDPSCELIWSFWYDVAHLDRAISAIRALDALPRSSVAARVISGLQRDESRSTLAQRRSMYGAQYGLATRPRTQRRQNRFPSAFRTLLERAASFHEADDNRTIRPNPLPLLHSLADVHALLSEGGGPDDDFVAGARRDMLVALYALQRPEVRAALRVTSPSVRRHPEVPVLDTIAANKEWVQPSTVYHAQLARLGERILLSVRSRTWPETSGSECAAAWARYWREDIQQYTLALEIVGWPSDKTIGPAPLHL
jgi:hypothetical protein